MAAAVLAEVNEGGKWSLLPWAQVGSCRCPRGPPSGEGCEAETTFMKAGGILEQRYPNRSEFCSFK